MKTPFHQLMLIRTINNRQDETGNDMKYSDAVKWLVNNDRNLFSELARKALQSAYEIGLSVEKYLPEAVEIDGVPYIRYDVKTNDDLSNKID